VFCYLGAEVSGVKSRSLACCLAACLGAAPVFAAELDPAVEEVQRCVEHNLPEHSSRQSVLLERRDRAGNERRLQATVWWKRDEHDRSRLLARVETPPDERGTGFLMIEGENGTELFSYLPELGRVRRVTSRSASTFLGTDLSYEDLEELRAVASRERVERLPDATVGGRPVYVLLGTPMAESQSAYERVVSQVDRETCVALHTSLEGAGNRVLKEFVVDFTDVEKQGGRWLPRKVRFRNLANGSETRLTLEKVEFEVEIPDRLFTQSELAKGH
jgi:outer membrane lipoprotein-sorting protein